MSDLIETLNNWEGHSLSNLLCILVKWFNADNVEFNITSRPEVASRIWLTIEFKINSHRMYVDGQEANLVKRRLIEQMDKLNIGGDARKELKQKSIQP